MRHPCGSPPRSVAVRICRVAYGNPGTAGAVLLFSPPRHTCPVPGAEAAARKTPLTPRPEPAPGTRAETGDSRIARARRHRRIRGKSPSSEARRPCGKDLHAPAGAVQQQVQPGQGVLDTEPPAHDFGNPGQRPTPARPAGCGRAGIQRRFQDTKLRRIELRAAPPGPLEARACRPPEANARRQRFADIRVTLNRRATSRSLAPVSIRSAAVSRTCSRRALSSAVKPPPSGYLILPA